MKFLYLALDVGAIAVPFLFSFHPRIRFNLTFRHSLSAIPLVAIPFVLWDVYFTRLGVWGFNDQYVSGYFLENLPFEEVLFFLFIPFSCLFTCYTLSKNVVGHLRLPHDRLVLLLTGIAVCSVGLLNSTLLYTLWSFVLCGLALCLAAWRLINPTAFLISYLVLLVPFFIVNGILTGTGIPGEVVWYNNAENLGLRILTIPIEDFAYGMLLIALNVILFEALRNRRPA